MSAAEIIDQYEESTREQREADTAFVKAHYRRLAAEARAKGWTPPTDEDTVGPVED